MKNKLKQKKEGIQIAVSPEAHKKLRNAGYKANPRRNLREQVYFIINLPINL